MKGSELFIQSLKNQGVKYIFGIVGREAKSILFDDPNIKFILTRHEFTAGIMAEVYARLTGRPQILFSTFGPGATNIVTPVASSYLDKSPMLTISAQVEKYDVNYNYTHQCVDQVSILKPITKYAKEIYSVKEIPEIIHKAFRATQLLPPGPSFVSIPFDLFDQEIDKQQAINLLKKYNYLNKKTVNYPNKKIIKKAHKLIMEAKHPIILVGNAVIREKATDELKNFVEKWNIPVVLTFGGKGAIPENHPLYIGTINKYLSYFLKFDVNQTIFSKVDVILTIGYDYAENTEPSQWTIGEKKKIINISSFSNTDKKLFNPDINIIGDIKTTLRELIKHNIDKKKKLDFSIFKNKLEKFLKSKGPQNIITTIRKVLGKDGILISDIGLHKQYAGLFSATYYPNTFLCSNGLGTFGFSLPAAMAAKLFYPKRKIIAVCGDGGFHSISHDLETAVRYNLPIICVIFKDNCFGLIKHYQKEGHHKTNPEVVDFGKVDFIKLAQANGCVGYKASISNLKVVLKKAINLSQPCVIEVPIKY